MDHNRLEERSFRISDSCHREIGEKTLIQKARCACVHWKYVAVAMNIMNDPVEPSVTAAPYIHGIQG